MARSLPFVCLLSFALMLAGAPFRMSAGDAVLPPAASRPVDFEKEIRPILMSRCYECHDERKQKSGYRLDLKDIAFKGGESGKPAIVPRDSASSRLVQRVAGVKADEVMPAKGPRLTDGEVGLLRAWIDQGADWPGHLAGEKKKRTSSLKRKARRCTFSLQFAQPLLPSSHLRKQLLAAVLVPRKEILQRRARHTSPTTPKAITRR